MSAAATKVSVFAPSFRTVERPSFESGKAGCASGLQAKASVLQPKGLVVISNIKIPCVTGGIASVGGRVPF